MSRASDRGFDPYRILQLDPEAEPEIIQVVYRRLARKYHPDVTPGPEAAAKMTELNAAMELLSDPERRAEYDRERALRERAGRSGGDGAGRSPGPDVHHGASASGRSHPGTPTAAGRAAGPGAARSNAGAGRSAAGVGGTGGPPPPRPQTVSGDWTSGRSTSGSGYDPNRMRTPEGEGAAGPPPGNPSGSVLNFGRYAGWSLGEVARTDLEYLEWLDRMAIGRSYRPELDTILRTAGRRRGAPVEEERRGLFRRP